MTIGVAFDGEANVQSWHVFGKICTDEIIVYGMGDVRGEEEAISVCLAKDRLENILLRVQSSNKGGLTYGSNRVG